MMTHDRLYNEQASWRDNKDKQNRLKRKKKIERYAFLGFGLFVASGYFLASNILNTISKSTKLNISLPLFPSLYLAYGFLLIGVVLVQGLKKETNFVIEQLKDQAQSDKTSVEVNDYSLEWDTLRRSNNRSYGTAYLVQLIMAASPPIVMILPQSLIQSLFESSSAQMGVIGIMMTLAIFSIFLFIKPAFKSFTVLARTPLHTNPFDLIQETFGSIFTDFEYLPEQGIAQEVIDNTQMFYSGIRYQTSNLIQGVYHNIKFQQADVVYQDVNFKQDRQSEKHDTEAVESDVFQGRILLIESDKSIDGNVIIVNKHFKYLNKSYIKEAKLIHVETENQEFNNHYDVYSSNEHEAFYILNPAIMNRLMKFEGQDSNENYREGIALNFKESQYTMAISDVNQTFFGLYFAASSHQEIQHRILSEASIITDTIEATTVL